MFNSFKKVLSKKTKNFSRNLYSNPRYYTIYILCICCVMLSIALALYSSAKKEEVRMLSYFATLTETTETTTETTTEVTTEAETTEIELTTVKYEDILKLKALGRFKITGYTPTCEHCCGKTDGIGASNRKIIVGEGVAMNRTDMRNYGLEYGDKIYIEGIGEREIVDTGCGQGTVDVACDSHDSCRAITGYYRVHYIVE